MAKESKHVAPSSTGGWVVRTYGATRATRKFATQQEAVRFGTELAMKKSTELYIHGRDGAVREKLNYRSTAPVRDGRKT
jgi:hypothetical protein